jgi:hypothetical protein
MAKNYSSAQGKRIDIDSIRLANEDTIAVGNLKVNARGDQLGPGGAVIKTRDQVMKEYYSLNSPTAKDEPITGLGKPAPSAKQVVADIIEEVPEGSGLDEADMGEPDTVVVPTPSPTTSGMPTIAPMRGSLANAVAEKASVVQKEKLPPKKANGIQRF